MLTQPERKHIRLTRELIRLLMVNFPANTMKLAEDARDNLDMVLNEQ